MPAERVISIRAPLRGVYKKAAFQEQPEFTCYDARDFFPHDWKTGRARVAVRPGWASFGSQNSVNLIATLNVAPDESYKRMLVTATGGQLYKWNISTATPTAVGGASAISTGRNVQCAPYLGELFIANDNAPVVFR